MKGFIVAKFGVFATKEDNEACCVYEVQALLHLDKEI